MVAMSGSVACTNAWVLMFSSLGEEVEADLGVDSCESNCPGWPGQSVACLGVSWCGPGNIQNNHCVRERKI